MNDNIFDVFLNAELRTQENDVNVSNTHNVEHSNISSAHSIFKSEEKVEKVFEIDNKIPRFSLPLKSTTNTNTSAYELNSTMIVPIDKKKSFSSFVAGSSNNLAFASAQSIALQNNVSGNISSLYIYGDTGLGKTHLLHAIANKINEEDPTLVVIFLSAADFMNQFIEATMAGALSHFMTKYTKLVDVLLIDDIQGISGKEATQNIFFQIFESLHQNKKRVVFTSDKQPNEILGLPDRLKSRLKGGLVVDIIKPDFETKIMILKSYASQKDVFIPDSVIELMANAKTESIRELEGFINLLSYTSNLDGRVIDDSLAKKYLKLDSILDKVDTPESILKQVSIKMKLMTADIKSVKQTKDLSNARHIAIYLIRERCSDLTLKAIGEFFGGRTHSTVSTSIKKVERRLVNDAAFLVLVEEIEKKLL